MFQLTTALHENLVHTLATLKALKSQVENLKNGKKIDPIGYTFTSSYGICSNLHTNDAYFRNVFKDGIKYRLVQLMFAGWYDLHNQNPDISWEYLSKISYEYPVGGIEEFDEEYDNNTFWSNPKRIEYLDYVIGYISNVLDNHEIISTENALLISKG